MKTRINAQTSSPDSQAGFVIGLIILTVLAIVLSGCSDDDVVNPDTRQQFVGSYYVEDISASTGIEYNYNIDISLGSNGEVEMSNFGGIVNVPVKAKVDGKTLTVTSQTFTNPNGSSITVSGSGTLIGKTLNFTYKMTDYIGNCVLTRKE